MIKIAICDDEEKSVALHEHIVRECLQSEGIGCEITTYTQSRNLFYDITDDGFFYDLILLDIEKTRRGYFVTSDNAAIAAFRERYLASIEEEYHNAIAKVEI